MREGLAASHKWIQEHGDQYRGLWVIVKDGQLLGAGSKLDKLKEQLGGFGGAIVTKIAPADCWRKGGDTGYEYVALTWGENALSDGKFGMARAALIRRGWEEYIRALRPGSNESGACIMRRPKDEPRMWTEKEILALFGPWCDRFYGISDSEQKEESNG